MERVLWVALDFPCIATFLYIVPGNIFFFSRAKSSDSDSRLDDVWSTCAFSPCTGYCQCPCSDRQPWFETWPQARFSNGLLFIFQCGSLPSIFQVLSMTLVLHLALPEELTLPLVLLLALVVVLDLQIPLGPLLYFVSPRFASWNNSTTLKWYIYKWEKVALLATVRAFLLIAEKNLYVCRLNFDFWYNENLSKPNSTPLTLNIKTCFALGGSLRSLPHVWTPSSYWDSHSCPPSCSHHHQVVSSQKSICW